MEQLAQNLFTVLESGDKRIDNLKDTATILVGGTRIGKSTLFNLLLGKMLIGKGKGLNTSYMLQSEDDDVAKISTAFKSETLVPNIKKDHSETQSLIDMAGFGDTRNYIGVIGVSYFLHKIFEKVKKARFILVINEFGMADPTGAKLIECFNGFIKMFRFDLMTPQIKEQLKNSLSMVVTKSQHLDYHPYLENAIEQLQDETFQTDNRSLIIELIQSLIDSNRIQGFKASKENGTPQEIERKFMDRFTKNLAWQYFDLQSAQQTVGESIISLPFSQDFDDLKEEDRNNFANDLNQKTQSYKNLSQIISAFLKTIINNWNDVVQRYKTSRQFVPSYFKLQNAFEAVRAFLKKYDVYNTEESVNVEFRPGYDFPSLVEAINSIAKAYQESENFIVDDVVDFKTKMTNIADIYNKILGVFVPFCSNENDEKLLARLNYIVQRGLIECGTLYELRKDLVTEILFSLKDSIENAFELPLKSFFEAFLTKMTSDLMPLVLSSFSNLEEYEKLLEEYQAKYGEEQQDKQLIPKQKCSIGSAKGDLHLRAAQNAKAFKSYEKVLRTYMQIMKEKNSFVEDVFLIEDEDSKALFMDQRRIILKMVSILKQMTRTEGFEPLNFALQLCKEQNLAYQAFQIYDLILDSQKIPLEHKTQVCLDYHNFLVEWGLLDKALEVLIRRQSIQTVEYDVYDDSMKMIAEFQDKRQQYKEAFHARAKSYTQQSGSNKKLQEILDCINANLPEDKVANN